MTLLGMNLFSLLANIVSIGNYMYLQKAHNIFGYTIICLINSVLFFTRGIMFKDYSGAFFEFFWIGVSIYGLIKIKYGKQTK